jgi:hypothetical protein
VLDYRAIMTRALLAVAILTSTAATASAGTYVGLGIGTSPAMSSDIEMTESVERSGRLLLGFRFGRLSLEGQAGRHDLFIYSDPYQSTMFGAALKYSHELGSNFEVYAKGGLQRTFLSAQGPVPSSRALPSDGDGHLLGAGFEYRLNLGVTGASIFVDYQYAKTSFGEGMTGGFDASSRMWTLGATVSL